MKTRTSKLDNMCDAELWAVVGSPSEESRELLTAMEKAQAAGAELSFGELRLQKLMDAAVEEFYSSDNDRKEKTFDEFIDYLTAHRSDLLVMTWVFNHANELYRWAESLEAK